MCRFTRCHSGNALYLSNSAAHCSSDVGHTSPVARHSTIDRPDRVSRVTPPSTTITNTAPAVVASHKPTRRRLRASLAAACAAPASAAPAASAAAVVSRRTRADVTCSDDRSGSGASAPHRAAACRRDTSGRCSAGAGGGEGCGRERRACVRNWSGGPAADLHGGARGRLPCHSHPAAAPPAAQTPTPVALRAVARARAPARAPGKAAWPCASTRVQLAGGLIECAPCLRRRSCTATVRSKS
jgi:hypothetical protein